MQFIKAKFMKDNQPSGRSYTYRCEDDVKVDDIVTNDKGSKLVVVDEEVDMAWVETYGADKIGVVKKYVSEEPKIKVNAEDLDQETQCKYCLISSDCSGASVKGGPDGPIFSYCVDHDSKEWFDEESYLESLKESEE